MINVAEHVKKVADNSFRFIKREKYRNMGGQKAPKIKKLIVNKQKHSTPSHDPFHKKKKTLFVCLSVFICFGIIFILVIADLVDQLLRFLTLGTCIIFIGFVLTLPFIVLFYILKREN